MIKKKDIYAHVAEATGQRKRDVREITDALLAYMHQTLSEGEDIQCPPLGKIKIVTQKAGTEKEKKVYRLSLTSPKVGDASDVALAVDHEVAE